MPSKITLIPLDKLIANPANPNRMSKSNFAALVSHIERTGRYEPIVVRPYPRRKDKYEIINGHHRCKALKQLGRSAAQCVVWDVDGAEADLLLATLNRLAGKDDLHKRSELISRLAGTGRFDSLDDARDRIRQLSKLLPETRRQIERLMELAIQKRPMLKLSEQAKPMASAVVFFLTDKQKDLLEKALAKAEDPEDSQTKAQCKAKALIKIAEEFLVHRDIQSD